MSWMDIIKVYGSNSPKTNEQLMATLKEMGYDVNSHPMFKGRFNPAVANYVIQNEGRAVKRPIRQMGQNKPKPNLPKPVQKPKPNLPKPVQKPITQTPPPKKQLPPQKPQQLPTSAAKRRAIPATSSKQRAWQQSRLDAAANKLRNKGKEQLSEEVKQIIKPPVEERQKQLRGPPRKFTNAQMLARSKKNKETPTEEVARRIKEENEKRQRTLDRIKRGPSGRPARKYAKTGGN